ncbi:MAG: hypothetical protein IPJ90_23935 [Anaerolineaceae bacterium]|nr:hypothetical protein [Anaerolineaceae bacterium]
MMLMPPTIVYSTVVADDETQRDKGGAKWSCLPAERLEQLVPFIRFTNAAVSHGDEEVGGAGGLKTAVTVIDTILVGKFKRVAD